MRHARVFQPSSKHSHRFSTALQPDRYIWWCLPLTPQVPRRKIPASLFVWSGFSGEVRLRQPPCSTARGKYRCSICRVSRFSASTRCVTCAATGCAPTLRDPSATMAGARAAATCCGRCRRPWALDFECDLVPSRPARRCGPGPASGNVPKLTAPHAEKHAAPFFVPAAFAAAGVVRNEATGIARSDFSVSSASTRR
jgi:hypothetical protein